MTSSRVEHSRHLNRVIFDNGVLRIQGRRFLVTVVLLAFFGACIGLLFTAMPVLIKGGIGLCLPILLWALVDVAFSKSVLTFDVESQTISLQRKSLRHETNYDGPAAGLVSITKRRQPNSDSVNTYDIILMFDDGASRVPLILESCVGADTAADKMSQWEERLKLVDAAAASSVAVPV